MDKKKHGKEKTILHVKPPKKIVVNPKVEPVDPDESDELLWGEMAPDTFAPDKPDKETDQIINLKDTRKKKGSNKRS